MQVFSKDWFLHHQKTLLWLVNNWLTKRWFRWVLRIRRCDCPIKTKIDQILPNSFTYDVKLKGDKLEATTDFRVNDKFARRLYFAFRPFWHVLHGWDWVTRKQPAWNMGFDTLTQYTGSIGADNPCDGNVYRGAVNETFATIRGGAGTTVDKNSVAASVWSSTTNNWFSYCMRGYTLFDTEALGASADISEAVYSLHGFAATNGLGASTLHVVTATPNSTSALVTSDYAFSNFGGTSFGSLAYASVNTSAYNNITLNASGRSAISKNGITQLGILNNWDMDGTFGGTWKSNDGSRLEFKSAATSGTSQDPKLVITYSLASTTPAFALLLGCG